MWPALLSGGVVFLGLERLTRGRASVPGHQGLGCGEAAGGVRGRQARGEGRGVHSSVCPVTIQTIGWANVPAQPGPVFSPCLKLLPEGLAGTVSRANASDSLLEILPSEPHLGRINHEDVEDGVAWESADQGAG